MKHIDQQYLKTPFYGSRRMVLALENLGFEVNRKRVQRLMQIMGLEAIYPKKRTSDPAKGHKKYPYLLRDLTITYPDQVWCTDITYIPLRSGFMYLVAIMDWYSRHVLSWRLSNSLETSFALRPWRKHCSRVAQRYSIATKEHSSPPASSRRGFMKEKFPSVWMGVAAPWTTCLLSGCGEV